MLQNLPLEVLDQVSLLNNWGQISMSTPQAELCQENGYDGVYQLDEEPMDLQIVLTSEATHIPSRGTPGSIGYDLFAAQTKVIPKKKIERISTDIKIRHGIKRNHCHRRSHRS